MIESRSLTRDELHAEARQRFGHDQMDWAFQCPSCEDVATGQEIYDALAKQPVQHPEYGRPMRYEEVLGQQCIGWILGAGAQRGCDYVAFGLVTAPWLVTLPHYYRPQPCFPLAPAPLGEEEKAEVDGITRLIAPSQALLAVEPAEVVVPRTELSRWENIATALNAAHAAGMPVGIDLDGTLTDRRAWSVVWDRGTERWTVAGYEDPAELATAVEEKDTRGGSQPSGAASTARAEILAALLAAGYNEPAAAELLARADREPRDPEPNPDFPETLAGGHALVVEYGDCVMNASCQCGKPFGTTTPDMSLDTFMPGWERHTATEVGD
ncbi:VVA0879 family protein [Streptomyces phaeochromogenes]|uniref:VVA0879 family protein n=1 Tax=Streptomyces phaeochromogenes TaxID=1923 RepID=UPI003699E345